MTLPRKARLWQTAHAETGDAKQTAGEVLRLCLLREEIVDSRMLHASHRRHVELVQPVAAEHTARDVSDRHANASVHPAVGRVTHEVARDQLRVPDAAFLV